MVVSLTLHHCDAARRVASSRGGLRGRTTRRRSFGLSALIVTPRAPTGGHTLRGEADMKVEEKLTTLGLELPSPQDLYHTHASGAHYISHFPVQNLLYLSGTTPRKNGQGYLAGVIGRDLTLEQGREAARYA